MKKISIFIYVFIITIIIGIIFSPFILQGKIPIPADALVGMYHPWRDSLVNQYPNGFPYKNSLITDPVRQQYPYKFLSINNIKQGIFPKWNPYNFAGTPLMANIQSAFFYPLNILFFVLNFSSAWSILVLLQPLLAGIFTFLYLHKLKLDKKASFLGAISFALGGFMVSWSQWNTIGHVALWLPLILLAKDKLMEKKSYWWIFILIFSEVAMILAGHLQISGYILVFTTVYLIARLWQKTNYTHQLPIRKIYLFILTGFSVLIISSIQLVPTFYFIFHSSRGFDLGSWQKIDWFLPYQHLLQFIAPDFFGNPATGNYWGIWNYGEFIGYIGIISLILAVSAMCFRKDKKTLFFGSILFISLFLALPTFIGKLPYQLNIPFIINLQPSRIMILIDFCLSVLTALGLDYVLKNLKQIRNYLIITLAFGVIIGIIWLVILFSAQLFTDTQIISGLAIAKRNMILPTILWFSYMLYLIINLFFKKNKLFQILTYLMIGIVVFDLIRFNQKFNPFVEASLLFPQTKTIEFLQRNLGEYRYLSMDRQIMPANVSTYYKIQSVDGYDPLYLQNYGEIMATWTRSLPDFTPASFNRILTPQNYSSFWADLLGVKYILSFDDLTDPKLQLVFTEGKTKVYQNRNIFKRAFLVEDVTNVVSKQEMISRMFAQPELLKNSAYTTNSDLIITPVRIQPDEKAEIISYTENKVVVKVNIAYSRVLVLTDIYYPDWKVYINGQPSTIYPVDFGLRGVVVPAGVSLVEFRI